jgi:hypothetical protein
MTLINIYIISWKGFHENAMKISERLKNKSANIRIIYSDPDPYFFIDKDFKSIKRPNELFWGDKFEACLSNCDSDFMLIIHADCECDDWENLYERCKSAILSYPVIGVWAPLINWVQIELEKTRIFKIESTSLNIVAQTDAIVFCLSRPIINRLKLARYKENIYGWGIDTMAVNCAYVNNMIAVIDDGVLVSHPKSRGYPTELALPQCNEFLKQLTLNEVIQNKLLWAHIQLLNKNLTN